MNATYELEPIEIVEWSLVDRPAIEWEWLIIKREGDIPMQIEKIKSKIEAALGPLKEALSEVKEDSKEAKRLKLVIANLEGMIKKQDDSEVEKQLEEVQEEEQKQQIEEEEVEKAGRRLSKATQETLLQVVKLLNQAIQALEKLAGSKEEEEKKPKYGYPEYGRTKKREGELDLAKIASEVIQAYKQGLLTEEEIARFSSVLQEVEE